MGDSRASSNITYIKKDMTTIEECKIDATIGNGKNMKCDLKGTVNMKHQGGGMVKLTEVLYVPQAVKNIFSVSRLISKGSMVGATKDKMAINKNGVNMIIDAKKLINNSMIFYLKKKYMPLKDRHIKR